MFRAFLIDDLPANQALELILCFCQFSNIRQNEHSTTKATISNPGTPDCG